MTANTASVKTSLSRCRFVRSIRGSAISVKHSTRANRMRAIQHLREPDRIFLKNASRNLSLLAFTSAMQAATILLAS